MTFFGHLRKNKAASLGVDIGAREERRRNNWEEPWTAGRRKRRASEELRGPASKRAHIDHLECKVLRAMQRLKRPQIQSQYEYSARAMSYRSHPWGIRNPFERYLRHVKAGFKEAKEFVDFYASYFNRSSSSNLPEQLAQQAADAEGVFYSMSIMYGHTEVVECRACSYMENARILHPQ